MDGAKQTAWGCLYHDGIVRGKRFIPCDRATLCIRHSDVAPSWFPTDAPRPHSGPAGNSPARGTKASRAGHGKVAHEGCLAGHICMKSPGDT